MEAIKSYQAELMDYMDVMYYITHAIITVLLWRGTFSLFGSRFKIPIHSIVAFWMGIKLIDNFNLIPSFTFFSIAWLLLATNEERHRNPSPWHATMTYGQTVTWYECDTDIQYDIEWDELPEQAAIVST